MRLSHPPFPPHWQSDFHQTNLSRSTECAYKGSSGHFLHHSSLIISILKKKKKTQFLEASTLFLSFFSHLGLPFSSKTGSHFPKALICVLKAAITLREDGSTKVSQQDGSLWKWKPSGVHQF